MIRFEKVVLKDLYESVNGLFAFTFYTRYNIEPDVIIKFIKKYEENGIINYEAGKLTLTEDGRHIVLKRKFIIKSGEGKFSNIPEDFLSKKIEINEPYLPNINEIPEEIYKNKKVV